MRRAPTSVAACTRPAAPRPAAAAPRPHLDHNSALEVRVRVRRHGQKFRARGGASMCEVLRRGKWRGPPPPPVKVALDDSLGPRPAFAPRTGQFVVP